MKEIPLVTVIMSVYNSETYLKEAVDSILNQTFSDFEFIIVDDASTDASTKILSEYSDHRIHIILNKENIGLTKSLNMCLEKARGFYIARMDADDISLPHRLEMQISFLNTHPEIVCVGGDSIIINSENKKVGRKKSLDNPIFLKFRMMLKNIISHPSLMFRKSTILKEGAYNEKFRNTQDYELWSRLLLKGYQFSNITEPLIKYRLHDASITHSLQGQESHSLAFITTLKNLSYYINTNNHELKIFFESYHKHNVCSLKNLVVIIKLISKFEKAFLEKENPNKKTTCSIRRYIRQEKFKTFQWYFKKRFSILYRIVVKIKKY